jgi:hypothetical protein
MGERKVEKIRKIKKVLGEDDMGIKKIKEW